MITVLFRESVIIAASGAADRVDGKKCKVRAIKLFQAINIFHTFIFRQVAFSPYFSLLLDSCHSMRIPGNTTVIICGFMRYAELQAQDDGRGIK